ncbi:hypothetical protein PoB_006725500 [Plakobranchus ocellatus]|uniref:Uncharacterized protein n=1 Tax=Plakobranchus ocellatus TaxID=259542 RepID=A0AAV4D9F7_9GAST|nr:hypothetical protein PoB_006725500 [Plakobranchus ocellatus]
MCWWHTNDNLIRSPESWGVGGTVASEFALRSAGPILSWVRAPPSALRSDGEPESLRSLCCGLAIYKTNHRSPLQRGPSSSAIIMVMRRWR